MLNAEPHIFEDICSDFPGLCSLSGLNDLDSLISSKNLLILMIVSSLTPKL